MPYIGRDTDKISNVEKLDTLTFDGSSSYTLQKNSVNFVPSSANTLLVSIDGVMQYGNFTISGSTIDFGVAIASTSTCDFVLHIGVGIITAPSDGSVTDAKLATSAINSQTALTTLADDDELLVYDTSATSLKKVDVDYFKNKPAFQASLSADQTVTNETLTKLQADTEDFDTDNCYDNSTNYRFTPNKAGKYKVYCMFSFNSSANDKNNQQQIKLYKNGSEVNRTWQILSSNERLVVMSPSFVVSMNGTTDYLELFGFLSVLSGGTPKFYTDTWWGAYRIGD